MPSYKAELHHPTKASENLQKLREERGLSRKEMAAIVGKSPTSYYNYESGIIPPPENVLQVVADYFGISVAEITGEEEDVGTPQKQEAPEKPAREEKPKKRTTPKERVKAEKSAPQVKKEPKMVIQSLAGGSISEEDILAKVEAEAPQAEAIYVKPEDNRIYWTSGKQHGSMPIW